MSIKYSLKVKKVDRVWNKPPLASAQQLWHAYRGNALGRLYVGPPRGLHTMEVSYTSKTILITGESASAVSTTDDLDTIADALYNAEAEALAQHRTLSPIVIVDKDGKVVAHSHRVPALIDDLYSSEFIYGEFGDPAFLRMIYRVAMGSPDQLALIRIGTRDYNAATFAASFSLLLSDLYHAILWKTGRDIDFLATLAVEDPTTFSAFTKVYPRSMVTMDQAHSDIVSLARGL